MRPPRWSRPLSVMAVAAMSLTIHAGSGATAQDAVSPEGSSSPPPQAVAPPLGDPVLEAMIPASVAGEAPTVSSIAGESLHGMLDPTVAQALGEALAGQGKPMADVSIVTAGTLSGASILGIRVAGGDASIVAPAIFGSMTGAEGVEQTSGQVAGKDVTILTLGSDSAYLYEAGETAWFVHADEPALSEIIGALP